jgi:hypothetical protein
MTNDRSLTPSLFLSSPGKVLFLSDMFLSLSVIVLSRSDNEIVHLAPFPLFFILVLSLLPPWDLAISPPLNGMLKSLLL